MASSRTRSAALTALLVTLLALAATAIGAQSAASAAIARVSFREVAVGTRAYNLPGEDKRAAGRVLRDAAQAARVLRRWGIDTEVAKSVDFARESLVVTLAPYQPTGGYRERIARLDVHGTEALVTASVGYEGGDFATQSLERPWVVIAVKRSALARVRTEPRVLLRQISRTY